MGKDVRLVCGCIILFFMILARMKGCWHKDIGQLQASVTAGETATGLVV